MPGFFDDLDKASDSSEKNNSSFFSDLPTQPSRTRSVLSAFPKGAIKGVGNAGKVINSPTDWLLNKIAPEFAEKKRKALKAGEEWIENTALPTQKGKNLEDILEFAGELAPTVALGEASIPMKVAQAFSGGGAKKVLKESGAPEWIQDLGGGVATAIPGITKNIASKALIPKAKDKELYDFLKSKGMSDKSITPILQGETKTSLLAPLASKGGRSSKIASDLKASVKPIYNDIQSKGTNAYLPHNKVVQFDTDFYNQLRKIRPKLQELIKKDTDRLLKNPITHRTLREFEMDLNDKIGSLTNGKASIGILKEVTEKAKNEIDRGLTRELTLANKAYGEGMAMAQRLDPKGVEGLLNLGSVGTKVYNIATLAKYAGGRAIAREFLTNSRLQRMHIKLLKAINDRKYNIAISLAESMAKESENQD